MGNTGQLVAGSVCDKIGYNALMVVSATGSALAVYLLWGFAHSATMIYLFAIVFGTIVSIYLPSIHCLFSNSILRRVVDSLARIHQQAQT